MRCLFYCIIFLTATITGLHAQSPSFSIASYIDKLPAVAVDANAAYNMYFPKTKKTPHQQYQADIQSYVDDLAKRSEYKSYLLTTLSTKTGRETERYDRTKLQLAKDQALDKKVKEASTEFFSKWKEWERETAIPIEALHKQRPDSKLADEELRIYRERVPLLIQKIKSQLVAFNNFMTSKGYNAIIDKADAANPYYIQLLEARGLMFDRLLKLNQLIDAVNGAAARALSYVKK